MIKKEKQLFDNLE